MNPELLTLRDALKLDHSDDAIMTALVSAFLVRRLIANALRLSQVSRVRPVATGRVVRSV